ncbi:MAG: DNA methyltransferase [Candidatus Binatia bacterium]
MTELTWDGKYDEQGRKVAPPKIALPFQTVETVNESAADRDRMQDLFASGRPTEWRNRLIWGDKKYVLPSLLEEFAGKVNLIYIDPPFATGGDFSFTANIPNDPEEDDEHNGLSFVKQPSVIEQKAYRDTWGTGLDGYLKWFHDTMHLLRDLLSAEGCAYIHLDYHVAHYAKAVLDEIFGPDGFRSELIWKRTSARSDVVGWGNIHDVIFYYSKSHDFTWNKIYQKHDEAYLEAKYANSDERGQYRTDNLTAAGLRNGDSGKPWRGIDPSQIGGHWKVNREAVTSLVAPAEAAQMTTQQKLDLLDANGFIYWPNKGRDGSKGTPSFKRYLKEGVALQDLIVDVPPVNSQAQERVGYATQKPEALLDRIVRASSDEGDLVLDCFCGSGTTAASAERLKRRWIACDLGRFAIHTTRKRLLGIPGVKPFVVQNLGKYERQAWQAAEFGESAEAGVHKYRQFLLDLYHAQPISGYVWLHGNKAGRMVHVGGVDAPVTRADISGIVTEFRKATGSGKGAPTRSGVDVLGWDFAFELNETAKQDAELAGIHLRLIRIPRELLDKKAVEQGDIKFFELAALRVTPKKKGRSVTLELTDFMIPLDDVPEDVQKAVTHWEQWIDYWAVDWNNSDDTFHNEWQTYRTRKDTKLARLTTHTYTEAGKYRVVVKVIDILGNDTTKVLQVEVK